MRSVFVLLLAVISVVAQAQTVKRVVLASGNVTSSATNYYPLNSGSLPSTTAPAFSIQINATPHATAISDTIVVYFEGSIDGTTYYKMTTLGTAVTSALTTSTVTYNPTTYETTMAGTSTSTTWGGGGVFLTPSWSFTPPFFRAVVTHAGGVKSITVTGYLYTKQ